LNFKLGFGAKDAEGDPQPQMFKLDVSRKSCIRETRAMTFQLNSMKDLIVMRMSKRRGAYLAVFVIGLVGGTGCTPVASYERAKLAHPTMTAAPIDGFGESHLRAITEGAVGGGAGTGSGCGCN
jgi:hypothetical protein